MREPAPAMRQRVCDSSQFDVGVVEMGGQAGGGTVGVLRSARRDQQRAWAARPPPRGGGPRVLHP
ncbi:hypothetical protein [Nocardia brasiliensis]|uniref:hypothetical protein n=1 Tax=Nocardia brasiliensis TaxID=37326 RepID=UPI0024555385|nr:hypothetical protein [Nocardia brasiliensis]